MMNPLGKNLLKDVSRSFFLSMRILPQPMREPVSLGYLLARASDTLADTETLNASLRMEMLDGMESVIHGGERAGWLDRLKRDVVPLQSHEGERVLLQRMGEVLDWLDALEDDDLRGAIFKVMKHIIHGQRLDIQRFELQEGFLFSEDDELEEYCYLVAGCVGEFWTEVGLHSIKKFSNIGSDELMALGRRYGIGLQLINILRDLPNDLEVGRCYLPHVDPNDIEGLMKESQRWRNHARQCLADGERYACSLLGRRARMATALPGMIGSRTLGLMDQADWESLRQGVKIKRSEVYRCAWDALILDVKIEGE